METSHCNPMHIFANSCADDRGDCVEWTCILIQLSDRPVQMVVFARLVCGDSS